MPYTWEPFFDYGLLGVVGFLVLTLLYRTLDYLFSRSDTKPGYITQAIEAHLENQRAQKDLYSALVQREKKQQELCERHAATLAEQSECAHEMCGSISQLKLMARDAYRMLRGVVQKGWDASAKDIERYCDEMEKRIDEA